jgi:sulfite reductase alpha subunit-like flavoprotein
MIRRIRKGLCTSWIKTLNANDELVFKVNRNNLKFSTEKNVPIIMISPGTGVAPMRSLIHDLINTYNYSASDLYLFFGNRFHDKDFLYEQEWDELTKNGKLTMFTAFSRENGGYVQDQLYLEGPLVADLLTKKRAIVYVCGSSGKMPTQVRITLETILQEQCGLNEEESKRYLLELEVANRYLQETW